MTNLFISEKNVNCKEEKRCLNCRLLLERRDQIKFCSRECDREFRKKNSVKNKTRVCKQCGNVFVIKSRNGIHKNRNEGQFCSKVCAGKFRTANKKCKEICCPVYFKVCDVCGKLFTTSRKNINKCSIWCRKKYNNRVTFNRNSSKKILLERECKYCGKKFTPIYGEQNRFFCSKDCLKKKYTFRKNKKKAEKYGVKYEHINPIKVLIRDGWVCQICGKKTPQKRRGSNYPNAPEVDHIVPISKGGDHLYSNLQCACRACNGKKSNNNSYGQLHLFGV